MPIIHALVARGTSVLAEYTPNAGYFPTTTRVVLSEISSEDTKMSCVYEQCVFHYIVEDKITYMCMCDDGNKKRIPFAFLEDIKDKFVSMFGSKAATAIAFSMNSDFGKVLQKQMEYFNSPAGDTFASVNNKLDDVKNVMIQNIDIVLQRGEQLELLVDKTENLQQEALKFQKSASNLKSAMIWKRVKIYFVIFLVVALIVWVITVIICGITYDRCK